MMTAAVNDTAAAPAPPEEVPDADMEGGEEELPKEEDNEKEEVD